MMWRPESWENPYPKLNSPAEEHWDAYELGADAMLEALRKNFVVTKYYQGYEIVPYRDCGVWVFIPDEETDG